MSSTNFNLYCVSVSICNVQSAHSLTGSAAEPLQCLDLALVFWCMFRPPLVLVAIRSISVGVSGDQALNDDWFPSCVVHNVSYNFRSSGLIILGNTYIKVRCFSPSPTAKLEILLLSLLSPVRIWLELGFFTITNPPTKTSAAYEAAFCFWFLLLSSHVNVFYS